MLSQYPKSVLLILSLALCLLIHLNPVGLHTQYGNGNGKYEDRIDAFSEHLVRNKVTNDILGTEALGPNLIFASGYPEDYNFTPEGNRAYKSQYGLQGRVLSFAAKTLGLNNQSQLDMFFQHSRQIYSLLLCASIFIFLLAIKQHLSFKIACSTAIILFFSQGLTLFAHNLYWGMWWHFLPFALMWLIYPKIKNSYVLLLLFPIAFTFIKTLNGLEFLTSFTLSLLVPIIFFETKNEDRKQALTKLVTVFVGSVIGFVFAVGLHLSDLAETLDGSQGAIEHLKQRAEARSGSIGEYSLFSEKGFSRAIGHLILPQTYIYPVNIGPPLIIIIPLFIWMHRRLKKQLSYQIDPSLFNATVFSLIATLSWFIFGYQHIMHHWWYSWLINHLSFLPMISVFFSAYLFDKSVFEQADQTQTS